MILQCTLIILDKFYKSYSHEEYSYQTLVSYLTSFNFQTKVPGSWPASASFMLLQSAFPVPSVVSRIDTPPQINNTMITVPLH